MRINKLIPAQGFWLPGDVVPQARPSVTRTGHVYYKKSSHDYRKRIVVMLRQQNMGRPVITEPVQVWMCFYREKPKSSKNIWPSTRPDIDNLIKQVVDALCCSKKPALGAGIIKDDGQVCVLFCMKEWSLPPFGAGVRISIKSLISQRRKR
jgi:Holliday junction resolvase RusA-like endonuclease